MKQKMKPAPRVLFDLDNLPKTVLGEYKLMQLLLKLYASQIRPAVKKAILDAYDNKIWDWKKCDGCTGVNEAHSPKGTRFPPCVMHDFRCWLSRRAKTFWKACKIRRKGDKLFLWAMIDFGIPKIMALPWNSAYGRWLGVRIAWYCWQMWKDQFNRKTKKGKK